MALQIDNSRKWEDADKLNRESFEVVSQPDKDVAAYKSAFEKAHEASIWEPNNPIILTTLGAAQYRTGAYEEAFKTLTRAEKLRADEGDEPNPGDLAFTAMSLHQLGRGDEAKAALEQLRTLLKDERFAEDEEVKALLAEAEGLIEGKRP